jgi:hypothetical protein
MQEKLNHSGIAAVLSFVFNGLGQIYNGQIRKGLLTIFFSTLSLLIFILGSVLIALWLINKIITPSHLIYGLIMFVLGIILISIIGIWSIFDAYRFTRNNQ